MNTMNTQVIGRRTRLVLVGKRIVLALLLVLYALFVCLKWTAVLVAHLAHHGAELVARGIAEVSGTPGEDVLAWLSAECRRESATSPRWTSSGQASAPPSFQRVVFVAEPAGAWTA